MNSKDKDSSPLRMNTTTQGRGPLQMNSRRQGLRSFVNETRNKQTFVNKQVNKDRGLCEHIAETK